MSRGPVATGMGRVLAAPLVAAMAALAVTLGSVAAWAQAAPRPSRPAAGGAAARPAAAGGGDIPVVPPGGGDQQGGDADEYDRRAKELDERLNAMLAIPEIPAAFALGVSAETVAHPGTLREAAAAVTAHLGADGSVEPGLAIEGAPFRSLFLKYDVDEWKKERQWWWQPVDSMRLSLATASDPAAAAGTAAPTLASAGLRFSLIDQRDYRNNWEFVKQVRTALAGCFPGGGRAKPGAGGKNPSRIAVGGACETELTKTLDKLDETLTNGHRLEFDAALTVAQGQPATSVDWRSARFWLAYDWAFGGGTLGGALEAQWRDPGANAAHVTDLTVGARASVGREAVSWSVSALYGKIGQTMDQTDDVLRYGTALSVKLASYGVARAGLQGSHDFDSGVDSAILFVAVAAANGDTVFSRAYSTTGLPPPQ